MDFFARQDKARRNTKWLVWYFVLSVLFTIVLVYGAVALIFLSRTGSEENAARLWNPQWFAGVTTVTLTVILLGNLYKFAVLSQGGGAVARSLGGRLLNANTTDADERKVHNVVEEMAIASGTPVPDIYILDDENAINAFAAGHSTKDTAIGVTRGAMMLLSRDELQGVIGHEFSHILNGDMRLNLRLMGFLHGLLCVAIIGRVLLQVSFRGAYRRRYLLAARNDGKGGGNLLPLLGLALIVVGSIGVFFGRLIKSAVSRQREFLADASSVQFTRNPSGLAGALKKIGGLVYGSRLQTARAEEASHLFFGNGLAQSWFALFATHPPLADRIKAIDPQFDGTFPAVSSPKRPEPGLESEPPARVRPPPIRPPQLSDLIGPRTQAGSEGRPAVSAARVLDSVGAPSSAHLDFAVTLLASLPASLTNATRDSLSAAALVYALLLSPEEKVRKRQQIFLEQELDPTVLRELRRLEAEARALKPAFRLPLVEMTLPALRRLSPGQYATFLKVNQALIESDQELDLFEYALQKMVARHLEPNFNPRGKSIVQYYSQRPLWPDFGVLLSALARAGNDDPEAVQRAFQAGVRQLGEAASHVQLKPEEACRLSSIDSALDRISQAVPKIKRDILTASIQTVSADGVIRPAEGELLRAVADSLDCPVPPFLATDS
jgi:Zn-dependent protease with chaperone function